MTCDFDYFRELLIKYGTDNPALILEPRTLDGFDERKHHHLDLLCDSGLLLEINSGVYRFTIKGHDFLSKIKEKADWEIFKKKANQADSGSFLSLIEFAVEPNKQVHNPINHRVGPKVFSIAENEKIDSTLASVMMPFDTEFNNVYEVIEGTTLQVGLKCRRADEIWKNPTIIQDIVDLIDKSFVVICDCTGKNANVFYEIGIAHTLGREVVLISQNKSDVPFDIQHLRYIEYSNNELGRDKLKIKLRDRIRELKKNY